MARCEDVKGPGECKAFGRDAVLVTEMTRFADGWVSIYKSTPSALDIVSYSYSPEIHAPLVSFLDTCELSIFTRKGTHIKASLWSNYEKLMRIKEPADVIAQV